MSVLFIGKRFYTNRDALRDHYGRIYQLPWYWSQAGISTQLWLIDHQSRENIVQTDDLLKIISTPVSNLAVFRQYAKQMYGYGATPVPDVVVASGDWYAGLIAYRLAKRWRARFVYDVYDKYDEFSGYWRLPGFDPFHFLLQRADARLFASRALMEQIGHDTQSDFIAPNGVDRQLFRPLDKQASRAALGLPPDVTFVGYFGGMGIDRGVDDLITAVRRLRGKGMDIELLLGGIARADMDVRQPGIRYLGNVPFERMPEALASCDLLAIPYRRSTFMDAGASNKIAEAIACDRPLVATRTPNFMANFPHQAEELGGMLATPGDADDLARVIGEQCERRLLVAMPQGFDWQSIADRLATSLELADPAAHSAAETEV